MDARTGLPVVGMVGAGQLARMTHQAAIALGQSLRVLADSADDGAALVAADVVVGDYRSLDDLRAFAAGCDVVTFDHEHVPNEHISALAADGVARASRRRRAAVRPGQGARCARRLDRARACPCPRWADLVARHRRADARRRSRAEVGWPVVLKATTRRLRRQGRLGGRLAPTPRPTLLALAAPRCSPRSGCRSRASWPRSWPARRSARVRPGRSCETVQRDGICVEVIAPAPGPGRRARRRRPSSWRCGSPPSSDVVGVLAVELFETTPARLLVNELAMRPHNSGALDDRGRAHVAVRAAPARGARLPARRDRR